MTADITWRTTKCPDAFLGVAYECSLATTGGIAGVISAGSVASGALPTGLTLASNKVIISGTPTATGLFTFTVSLTDSPDTAVASPTLTIRVRDYDDLADGPTLDATDRVAASIKKLRFS